MNMFQSCSSVFHGEKRLNGAYILIPFTFLA